MKQNLIFGTLMATFMGTFLFMFVQLLELARSEGQFWQEAFMCASYQVCPTELSGDEGYERWNRSIQNLGM